MTPYGDEHQEGWMQLLVHGAGSSAGSGGGGGWEGDNNSDGDVRHEPVGIILAIQIPNIWPTFFDNISFFLVLVTVCYKNKGMKFCMFSRVNRTSPTPTPAHKLCRWEFLSLNSWAYLGGVFLLVVQGFSNSD